MMHTFTQCYYKLLQGINFVHNVNVSGGEI